MATTGWCSWNFSKHPLHPVMRWGHIVLFDTTARCVTVPCNFSGSNSFSGVAAPSIPYLYINLTVEAGRLAFLMDSIHYTWHPECYMCLSIIFRRPNVSLFNEWVQSTLLVSLFMTIIIFYLCNHQPQLTVQKLFVIFVPCFRFYHLKPNLQDMKIHSSPRRCTHICILNLINLIHYFSRSSFVWTVYSTTLLDLVFGLNLAQVPQPAILSRCEFKIVSFP